MAEARERLYELELRVQFVAPARVSQPTRPGQTPYWNRNLPPEADRAVLDAIDRFIADLKAQGLTIARVGHGVTGRDLLERTEG